MDIIFESNLLLNMSSQHVEGDMNEIKHARTISMNTTAWWIIVLLSLFYPQHAVS